MAANAFSSRPRMRPSFGLEIACTPDRMMAAIERRRRLDAREIEGDVTRRHAVLRVPTHERKLWTPCLDLTVEPAGGDPGAERTRIWGTFSPRPEIWTAFVFAMGTLAVLSLFASMFGIAQLALGHLPTALAIPLASVFLAAGLYAAALVGQGLSLTEMYRLRAFVDDCLRDVEQGPITAEAIDGDKDDVPYFP